jgi:hypothetical protein
MLFLELIRQALQGEENIHPIDRRMAKHWVKERLRRIYPHLQSNPQGLEKAYNELGIEAHEGSGKGNGTVYEITLPESAK